MLNFKQLYLRPNALTLIFCAALLHIHPSATRADDIIIDNSQLPATGFVAAPLVAIRPVTTTKMNFYLANTKITKNLIVRSAASFPEVQTKLNQLGISDPTEMSMVDFIAAVRASDYPSRYLYKASTPSYSSSSYPSIISNYEQAEANTWDAKTLTNMVLTGIVNTKAETISMIDGNKVEWFKIDDKYANSIEDIYKKFGYLHNDLSPIEISQQFASIKDDVVQYDALQKSILENIGEITFGIPLVYTADEMNLVIPNSVKKSHDVYWVDLVVTYRGVDPNDVAEMVFNVAIPEQSVALKLIPLRLGVEVSRRENEGVPKIGVGYGGAEISVGEFFSQSVSFKFLKPTIQAYGEGERNFSWKITGEAINAGSHRFAAILMVPKGVAEIDFAFSGHVRLRKSFMGEWYDGELIAGTDPCVLPVSF